VSLVVIGPSPAYQPHCIFSPTANELMDTFKQSHLAFSSSKYHSKLLSRGSFSNGREEQTDEQLRSVTSVRNQRSDPLGEQWSDARSRTAEQNARRIPA